MSSPWVYLPSPHQPQSCLQQVLSTELVLGAGGGGLGGVLGERQGGVAESQRDWRSENLGLVTTPLTLCPWTLCVCACAGVCVVLTVYQVLLGAVI